MGMSAVVSKLPSERSGSTCSGSESQTGLPKPPVVLPKSEKAVLKAIKITTRRMKKEEAQKTSHKPSQSSSKHRAERHKSDKSEHKSSRSSKSSERNHREKTEDGHRHNESNPGKHSQDQSEQPPRDRRDDRSENRHQNQTDVRQKTRRQSHDAVESSRQNNEALPNVETERPGRSSNKHIRDKPEQRHYSSDRVISNSSYSSHTSQLSRPSSIEHAIVTQSFPMTQRKLLQDPESGQYFFVDMPVQVKTKTFFDPETGSYVQLPVQPLEGAVPQASTLEVLTQPMVVYHSFVPVPLSPMNHASTIQASHMEPRMRQMHCNEGHQYLEPVYGQPDHMLGEFLGTEELDCPS
ncbi:Cardiac-enriched FHL2-interacting protein [Dissostichus eleginoides]|uniref:Cardiac-enriched FHL2-interacting protein n=1 Tax=Dissostichus eleginoides TaxID=100907 RepID=A0AAD9EYU0_DISEL|nr:Cardiac-enriched FHL2-interacting protein [Dissostichus eleginoides]